MPEPLPLAAQPEYLTETLRRSGALGTGRVSDVAVESSKETILSRIIRLRLSYDGAEGGAPASLILKTGQPERVGAHWNGGRFEVAFYTQIAATMSMRLVPRCFDAVWDGETRDWHLLLEDLTDSHFTLTHWPMPPTRPQSEAIMAARARFHAAWWDDPRFGTSIGTWLEPDDPQVQRFAEEFARFADRVGDRLPAERRAVYERLIEEGHRLNARYHTHRNMTLLHGDAHVWNVFLPRDGGSDVRLFDWDGWRIDVATDDLAYMMALHWFPDHRRRHERDLLDHYHRELLAQGVTGYDRKALDNDYRLSVLWQIATPVWQAAYNIPSAIWWHHLERIFLAVDDLGCLELIE
ncbi:MAG: phosphotransferase [Alphaproteobacteria bacterium]|nr:phosphotransferase [Alphaproteobacteria bacterium]